MDLPHRPRSAAFVSGVFPAKARVRQPFPVGTRKSWPVNAMPQRTTIAAKRHRHSALPVSHSRSHIHWARALRVRRLVCDDSVKSHSKSVFRTGNDFFNRLVSIGHTAFRRKKAIFQGRIVGSKPPIRWSVCLARSTPPVVKCAPGRPVLQRVVRFRLYRGAFQRFCGLPLIPIPIRRSAW